MKDKRMYFILYSSSDGTYDNSQIEARGVLPLVGDLKSKSIFLFRGELFHLIETSRVLRDEGPFLEIPDNVVEVMFGCEVFDIFHQQIPWDIRKRIRDPVIVVRTVLTCAVVQQYLTLHPDSCSG
jgi:hypothetical protein